METFDPKTPVFTLTAEQFSELLRTAIKEALETTDIPKTVEEKYYSPREAAMILGYSESTLLRWRKSKVLEAHKEGGLLRYTKSDLDNFHKPRKPC